MRIGIIVAMDKEFTQLRSLIDNSMTERRNHKDFVMGTIGQNAVIMQQCGIGKVNAAIGTVEMIDNYQPELVISTGVAGGANVNLNVTDVVVGTYYVYHDFYCGSECDFGQVMGLPARFHAPEELVSTAMQLKCSTKIHQGLMVSGDWFVDSRDKMSEILAHFPEAMAVDMESCAIAQTCYNYKTPFISFRVISDVPLKDNKASQYFDFWNRLAEGSFNVTKAFLQAI